jgi:dTDP-4-dehydrorhamnose reductase
MSNPVILITGAKGQLGKELEVISRDSHSFNYVFLTREELAVDNASQVRKVFQQYEPDFCINCAAYTAVDKAESEKESAFAVNADGSGNLAASCKEHGTKLIHISTDYVFDGTSSTPYKETDAVNPINSYGASKLMGEQLCLQNDPDVIIIRTAWVYSVYGNNFVKTMLRLMKERPQINVVNDQIGAPTWAADLAACIMHIVDDCSKESTKWKPGIYHYSNKGRISWYEFALAIKELAGMTCQVNAILTEQYPTAAKRPSFSLLNTQKIQSAFGCNIAEWKTSLTKCLALINT